MTGERRKFRREGEERRRDALISAALDLIAEGGPGAATVRAIADKIAVMYRGAVVRYGTKTDVLTPPYDDYTDLLLSSAPEMRIGWLEEVLAHRKMESAGN